jgi:peptidoglycan/LPS O-acetylase OafA/YrhL
MAARPPLRALTSWRFLAALGVFIAHEVGGIRHGQPIAHPLVRWLVAFGRQGTNGVTFFFILSGFILMYNYHDRLVHNRDSWQRFWIARIARIYPVYFLTFTAAILPFVIHERAQGWLYLLRTAVVQIAVVQDWTVHTAIYIAAYNGPSWTISVEFFFYLMFPIVLLRVRRWSLLALTLVMLVGWLIIWLAAQMLSHDPTLSWWLINSPPARFVDFFTGMTLGKLFLQRSSRQRLSYQQASWAEGGLILLLGLLAAMQTAAPHLVQSRLYYYPVMIGIIWRFAGAEGWFSQQLSHQRWVYLGELSFAFYMWHVVVLNWTLGPAVYLFHSPLSVLIVIAVIDLLLTTVISHCTYAYFERPARQYLRARGERLIRSASESSFSE